MIWHRRWSLATSTILAVVLLVYLTREKLKLVFVAISIYRAHIFTAPLRAPGESGFYRLAENARFYLDFAAIPVDRSTRLKLLNPTLKTRGTAAPPARPARCGRQLGTWNRRLVPQGVLLGRWTAGVPTVATV